MAAIGQVSRVVLRRFRSFRDTDVPLGRLSVLVGPNNCGKSNFLDAFRFLRDALEEGLDKATEARGGFQNLRFAGAEKGAIRIELDLRVPRILEDKERLADGKYLLEFKEDRRGVVEIQREIFRFKGKPGRGRRLQAIKVERGRATITRAGGTKDSLPDLRQGRLALRALSDRVDLPEVEYLREFIYAIQIYDLRPERARKEAPFRDERLLAPSGENLAGVLHRLSKREPEIFDRLVDVLRTAIPSLQRIEPRREQTRREEVVRVLVHERRLDRTFDLADSSDGVVRLLGLLTVLFAASGVPLVCFEEPEQGLHPHALKPLAEVMRLATKWTQVLATTHSPALVAELRPEDLIVVDRLRGETRMPRTTQGEIRNTLKKFGAVPIDLGSLWLSGLIRGVPSMTG